MDRWAISAARNDLDFRVNVFFKRETKTGPFIACYPGEEYELKKRYHALPCTPHVGQTTFHLFEGLSKKEKGKRARKGSDDDDDDDEDEGFDFDFDDDDLWDAAFAKVAARTCVPLTPSSYTPPTLPRIFVPAELRYPAPCPQYMIGRIPLAAEVQYSGYRDLEPRTTLLAVNTTYLADIPSDTLAVVYRDGYWGLNEITLYAQHYDHHAPWLGYITIDDERLRQPLHRDHRKYVWTDGLRGDHTKSAVPSIIDAFTEARRFLADELKWVCQRVLKNRNLLNQDVEESDLPLWRIHDALNAWGNLVQGVAGWTEFVLYFRAFQRAALEMDACIRWAYDVFHYPTLKSPKRHPGHALRGSIFDDKDYEVFLAFARYKISAYLVNNGFPVPDPSIPKLPSPPFRNHVAGARDVLINPGKFP